MSANKNTPSPLENFFIGAFSGLSDVIISHPLFVMKSYLQQGKSIIWRLSSLYEGAVLNALSFMPITAIQVSVTNWIEKNIFCNTLNFTKSILASFLAGTISALISCPVELIMLLQANLHYLGFLAAIQLQIHTFGISGLFIGFAATALREGIFSMCFNSIPNKIQQVIKPYCANENASNIISGLISGSIGTLISQPFDTIKTVQQSSISPLGFFQTAAQLGFQNLFSGLVSRSISVILSITLMNWVKQQLENYILNPIPNSLQPS